MNIIDLATADLFKKRTLSVKPETNLLSVITCLVSAGVWIDGRYTIDVTSNGTKIEFLATDLQWEVIKMLIANMDKYLDDAIKNYGLDEIFKK